MAMCKAAPTVSASASQRLEIERTESARDPVDLQARTSRRERSLAAALAEAARTADPDFLRIALGQRKPARCDQFTGQPRLHPQHNDKAGVPAGPGSSDGLRHR